MTASNHEACIACWLHDRAHDACRIVQPPDHLLNDVRLERNNMDGDHRVTFIEPGSKADQASLSQYPATSY